MNASLIYKLMDDVSLFSDETLIELKEIVEQYPCFSIAKILYLKNLAVLNKTDFTDELKRLSIYIPDRRKLFLLIEDKLESQSSLTMTGNQEREDTFDLIDSFLSERGNTDTYDWNKTVVGASVSTDYMFWAMSEQPPVGGENVSTETVPLKHQQLIDSFLNEEKPKRFVPQDPKTVEKEEAALAEAPEVSWSQDDSFFTETLAQIYIKQKRYERALQIIEKLSLKYPEKNVYFADQIRFLEKLIINNKNIK